MDQQDESEEVLCRIQENKNLMIILRKELSEENKILWEKEEEEKDI